MPEAPYELRGPRLESVPGLGHLTLGGFLLEVCSTYSEREALVFDDPLRDGSTVRWTYRDLERAARQVAAALLSLGIGKGARVAMLLANRPEAVAVYFGAALAGGVVVPLSTFSTPRELDQLLRDCDASVLITQTAMGTHRFAHTVAALLGSGGGDAAYPFLRHAVAIGPEPDLAGLESWDAFLKRGTAVADGLVDAVHAAVTPADHGLIIYSSGTTSAPKGMLHNHRAPTLQFWLQRALFGRTTETRMWTPLPLFWTAGMNTAMGATLAAGGCWVMQEGFDAGAALALMERERVTEPYTLPHQATTLNEHPAWPTTDLSSLRSVYGKSVFPRHPTVTGDPNWRMPVGWGMSETCAFICAHPFTSSRDVMRASTGTLLPGYRLRVVDPATGEVLPAGQSGELVVRGATLMEHYVGKTREECFDDDGWFHTGDVGHVDESGHVHWAGRRTEMIKTGGANVAPAEIEVELRACAPVKLARVLALPDPRLEQIAVLCVELRDDAAPDVDAAWIQQFLRERLAAYKVPKTVLIFEPGQIPMTSSGTKVRDDALRALVVARADAAREEGPHRD